jgi:putative SOS response-associated peptidase YedK
MTEDACAAGTLSKEGRIMCFNAALTKKQRELSAEFDIPVSMIPDLPVWHHVSGFTHPDLPLICSDSPDRIVAGKWGLIPQWARTRDRALEIREKTLNARSETARVLPSFKFSVKDRRCLVLVDGFFEPHHHEGRSYPFFCRYRDGGIMSLAGLFSDWTGPESGETVRTFTILTCDALGILEKVHNRKKRMPVILEGDSRREWIQPELSEERFRDLLRPAANGKIEVWPVSKMIYGKGRDNNVPEARTPVFYPELQGMLP